MNENAGKPAAFLVKREDAKKDKGAAVLGSAFEEIAPKVENIEAVNNVKKEDLQIRKTMDSGERVIDSAKGSADNENIAVSQHVKGDATLEAKRHSAITFDMDIYMTLTDLKRMKMLSIHKYCNAAIREKLVKDFSIDLERNKKLIAK